MAGDKETLLSMGFDSARVECKVVPALLQSPRNPFIIHPVGALKATGNRGLQPAMDHILEHEGDPIPELGGVTEQSGSGSAPMNVDDEDEDMEALTSLGVLKGSAAAIAAAAAPAEANVRTWSRYFQDDTYSWSIEHQVFSMRQNFQEYCSCQFPRRKKWSRSIRRIY